MKFIPDWCNTPEICEQAVDTRPGVLEFFADQYKTSRMCEGVIGGYLCAFKFVPDWFVTQDICDNIKTREDFDLNADEFVTWYNGYPQRKVQKAQVKAELMPIAWHPSRWWNWCIPEDDKKETEKL